MYYADVPNSNHPSQEKLRKMKTNRLLLWAAIFVSVSSIVAQVFSVQIYITLWILSLPLLLLFPARIFLGFVAIQRILKKNAKHRLEAFISLVLLVASFLIVQAINPFSTDFHLLIKSSAEQTIQQVQTSWELSGELAAYRQAIAAKEWHSLQVGIERRDLQWARYAKFQMDGNTFVATFTRYTLSFGDSSISYVYRSDGQIPSLVKPRHRLASHWYVQ